MLKHSVELGKPLGQILKGSRDSMSLDVFQEHAYNNLHTDKLFFFQQSFSCMLNINDLT